MMKKLGLTTRETAWVLGLSESQVRRLLAAGSLQYAVSRRLVDPASAVQLMPADVLLALRMAAMDALLDRRIKTPAPATRYAVPPPITRFPDLICGSGALNGAFDSEQAGVRFRHENTT
jgi:hypothetical protein